MALRHRIFALVVGFALLLAVFIGGVYFNRYTLDKTPSGIKFIQDILVNHPGVILDSRRVQNAVSAAYEIRAVKGQANARRTALEIYNADRVILSATPFLGNAKDGFLMVEVTDYNCAPCRASAVAVQQILSAIPDLKVYLVYLPVYGVNSELAARAGIAVFRQSPDRFTKFHDQMMASKAPLSQSHITSMVAGLGLDVGKFQALLNDQKTIETLDHMQKFTKGLNLSGAPAFLMGDEFVEGGIGVGKLQSMILSYTEAQSRP